MQGHFVVTEDAKKKVNQSQADLDGSSFDVLALGSLVTQLSRGELSSQLLICSQRAYVLRSGILL